MHVTPKARVSCIQFIANQSTWNTMRISAHAHNVNRWLNTLQLLPLKPVSYPKSFRKKSPTQHAILKKKVRALEMGSSMFKGPDGLGASSLC